MPADILELVERYRQDEASTDRIFESEGYRIGRDPNPQWERRVAAFTEMLAEAREGSWRARGYLLHEAQSIDDFPNLFGDVLQRVMLGTYREWQVPYQRFVRVDNAVPDFRTVRRFATDGLEGTLSEVPELDQYPEGSLSETPYSYSVTKHGRIVSLSWETLINDDLGAFADRPQRLGRAARRSEQRFVTELYVDANGPHASLYTAGNNNIISGNPALTVDGLRQGVNTLHAQTDEDGEPIFFDRFVLVVPPALQITAQEILSATQVRVTVGGDELVTTNVPASLVTELVVDPYIPLVASDANGDTSWFLFSSADGGSRPALEIGFLRGHAEPAIFVKQPDAVRVGGGAERVSASFHTDTQQHKVRHVFGGVRLDPKVTAASNGSGA